MAKKIFYLIVAVLSSISIHAQTTEGKNFWLTFGQNASSNYTQVELQIRIVSGKNSTTGSIYFTNLGFSVPFNMNANEVFTYTLDNTQKQAVYLTPTDTISYKSIYITSDELISVYALNFINPAQDASNILPVTALYEEYYLISYTSAGFDRYAVVATQNNTKLYHDGDLAATLEAGEVYYKLSPIMNMGMTGAHITATHPVALFAVHSCATLPYSISCSHLMQQLSPVKTWGNNFFVPSSLFTHDIVRMVVSQNNTDITQTGGTVQIVLGGQANLTNLQAGQFVQLAISDTGCYIKTNKPIGVCSYLTGYNLNLSVPAQCWIPAIEQAVAKVQIAPFIPNNVWPPYLTNHYALVCAPTVAKYDTKVSIGGASPTDLTGGSWMENAPSEMSFYSMPLTNDTTSYTFSNQKGLIILGYAGGFSSSYYYLAGSAMRELDAAFYANDVHFQDLEEHPFCSGEVSFRAELDNISVEMDSIKWYINGAEYLQAQDQLEWSKFFSVGEYEIKMWVRFENDSTISKTGTLKIKACEFAFYANNVHHLNLPDTTFCDKNVYFRAEIEDFNAAQDSIKWYINGTEYEPARGLLEWSKDFETGVYPIEMWVRFANGETATIPSTLKMEVFWIKIRNVRY